MTRGKGPHPSSQKSSPISQPLSASAQVGMSAFAPPVETVSVATPP
jgi:hypothetical protein